VSNIIPQRFHEWGRCERQKPRSKLLQLAVRENLAEVADRIVDAANI
jgi:hypothetical protein